VEAANMKRDASNRPRSRSAFVISSTSDSVNGTLGFDHDPNLEWKEESGSNNQGGSLENRLTDRSDSVFPPTPPLHDF
jgi:hypothetical protein